MTATTQNAVTPLLGINLNGVYAPPGTYLDQPGWPHFPGTPIHASGDTKWVFAVCGTTALTAGEAITLSTDGNFTASAGSGYTTPNAVPVGYGFWAQATGNAV
jgi:hypothetical protein